MDSNETRSRALGLLKLLGGTAGAAFIFSAIANGIVFSQAWDLNYFQVASTNDIVMNALSWGVVIAFFAVVFGLFAGSYWIADLFLKWQGRGRRTFFDVFPADPKWPPIVRQAYTSVGTWFAKESVWTLWRRTYLAFTFGYALIQSVAIVADSPAMEFFRGDPFLYRSGYRVLSMPEGVPACPEGEVLWTGERAAVLRCEGLLRVLHGVDGLVTQKN
ncbi:hypothetical protein [Brevundimonas naejangsanensis]|uniref:hypothetical protein n=1 Tax=Brevundimonas naejangsanensis TaxID=588932 RepID=UPI0039F654DC